jgi:hypothetical protein
MEPPRCEGRGEFATQSVTSALLRVPPEDREEAFEAFAKDLAKAKKLF